MSRIRGRDTGPEQVLRRALWAAGMRYRLHSRTPVGRPDIVMKMRRVAIFIDGCFWHGCPEHYVRPRSRTAFWSAKLRENVARDIRQTAALTEQGWSVLRFWEHEVFTDVEGVVERIGRARAGQAARSSAEWRVLAAEPLDEAGTRERRVLCSLRDPSRTRVVEQKRHTRKWRADRGQ